MQDQEKDTIYQHLYIWKKYCKIFSFPLLCIGISTRYYFHNYHLQLHEDIFYWFFLKRIFMLLIHFGAFFMLLFYNIQNLHLYR